MRTILFSPINQATDAAKQVMKAAADVCHNQLSIYGLNTTHGLSETKWRQTLDAREVMGLAKTEAIANRWNKCLNDIKSKQADTLVFYFPDVEEGMAMETAAIAYHAFSRGHKIHILVNYRNPLYSVLLWELFAEDQNPPRFLHHVSDILAAA